MDLRQVLGAKPARFYALGCPKPGHTQAFFQEFPHVQREPFSAAGLGEHMRQFLDPPTSIQGYLDIAALNGPITKPVMQPVQTPQDDGQRVLDLMREVQRQSFDGSQF